MMIYVVLGMHKSGTTLVAQMLHNSGINMVNEIENQPAVKNLYEIRESQSSNNKFRQRDIRHTAMLYERFSTFILNQKILALNSSKPVPINTQHSLNEVFSAPLIVKPNLIEQMHDIITECNIQYADWGFKDPRTCITYDFWKTELPAHKLVVVFRSYGEVIRHYGAVGWRQFHLVLTWKAIRAWNYYNKLIIGHLKTTRQPFIVVNFDSLMNNQDEFNRLEKFIGRQLIDARQKKLRHNISSDPYHMPMAGNIMARFLAEKPGIILNELYLLQNYPSGQ